jgi:Zn-dependent peptidase ImmA (M78 family)/transcriptional regulator with XRE-family HTH domain
MDKKFNGEMLMLARQTRRMSQADIVSALKGRITQGTLSKIEHGMVQPDDGVKNAIANALAVKPSFFENSTYTRAMPVSYHRKRQKLAAKDEAAIHGQSEILRLNIRKMLESIELEHRLPSIPHLDVHSHGGQIETIAQTVRQLWDVPRGPVKSVTKLVEDAGAVVVLFSFGTHLMDGFAQRADSFPAIVFLNDALPKDRYRFSLCHEIGHLTMHLTPNPTQEIEANRFSSAFLMPRADIIHHLHNLSSQKLQELKLYLGVSMHALVYRAWELGTISDRSKKYFYIELTKRGWRESEPVEVVAPETPTALADVVGAHIGELGYSVADISELFGLEEREVRAIYPIPRIKPKLRLVVG